MKALGMLRVCEYYSKVMLLPNENDTHGFDIIPSSTFDFALYPIARLPISGLPDSTCADRVGAM